MKDYYHQLIFIYYNRMIMTGGFGDVSIYYNPSITGYGPSKLEIMINNTLFWYIMGLIIYFIITLIIYISFRVKKHEHPLLDALKISWIWGILIVFILYNLYMIFVGTCNTCGYVLGQEDPMIKLLLLDVGLIFFMVIALIFYFGEIKGKKNRINNKIE